MLCGDRAVEGEAGDVEIIRRDGSESIVLKAPQKEGTMLKFTHCAYEECPDPPASDTIPRCALHELIEAARAWRRAHLGGDHIAQAVSRKDLAEAVKQYDEGQK